MVDKGCYQKLNLFCRNMAFKFIFVGMVMRLDILIKMGLLIISLELVEIQVERMVARIRQWEITFSVF